MVRRYGDPVEVKAGAEGGSPGAGAPDSFLWRGQLYVVRSVLGHWRERRAWWNEPAARAVHGETARSVVGGVALDAADAAGFAAEREVWQVEASAGRRVGVYGLCRGPGSRWSLIRVAD